MSKPVRPVPWWGHVLLEYAIAAGLVDLGLRLSGSSEELLIGCAGLVVLPAVLTKTGTGLIRVISPRLHGALDFAVAFLLALSPFLAWAFHDAAGLVAVIVVEGVALVVVGLSLRSPTSIGAGSKASEEVRSKGGSFELLLGKGLRVSGRLWGRSGGTNGVSRRLGRAVGRLAGRWTKGSGS